MKTLPYLEVLLMIGFIRMCVRPNAADTHTYPRVLGWPVQPEPNQNQARAEVFEPGPNPY